MTSPKNGERWKLKPLDKLEEVVMSLNKNVDRKATSIEAKKIMKEIERQVSSVSLHKVISCNRSAIASPTPNANVAKKLLLFDHINVSPKTEDSNSRTTSEVPEMEPMESLVHRKAAPFTKRLETLRKALGGDLEEDERNENEAEPTHEKDVTITFDKNNTKYNDAKIMAMEVIIDVDEEQASEIDEEILGPFHEGNLEIRRDPWGLKECVVVNAAQCVRRRRHPNRRYRKEGCFLVPTGSHETAQWH